jgi:hypothetical protein
MYDTFPRRRNEFKRETVECALFIVGAPKAEKTKNGFFGFEKIRPMCLPGKITSRKVYGAERSLPFLKGGGGRGFLESI